MARLLFFSFFALLGTLFFCALNESFSWWTILTGVVIAASGSFLFIRKLDTGFGYTRILVYSLHLAKLFVNIFHSSVREILLLHRKRPVSIDTLECDEKIGSVAVANAITLTPGTLTLEKEDDTLLVLSFSNRTKEHQA